MGLFTTQFIDAAQKQDEKQDEICCNCGQCESNKIEESIREIEYFRWLTATGGNPVAEDETQRFWFEAQQEASINKS